MQLMGVINFSSFDLVAQTALGRFVMPRVRRWVHVGLAGFSLWMALFFLTDRHLA
jgi:hypothetical protein